METGRSPLSVNKVEVLVAIGAIIFTGLGLHFALWNAYPVGSNPDFPLDSWTNNRLSVGRPILFNTWVVPISIILSLSSIFLVRGIANQRFQFFSRINHFALAWPLLLFPLATYLDFYSLYCFPFGLVLPVLSLFESSKSRKWLGSLFVIIWNVICFVIVGYYLVHNDYYFGD